MTTIDVMIDKVPYKYMTDNLNRCDAKANAAWVLYDLNGTVACKCFFGLIQDKDGGSSHASLCRTVCTMSFLETAESVATLPPFSPIEGQKWFDQISSQ
jgi:hypothetical protein